MFIARDWLKLLSPLGSGDGHFREAMFFLVMRGRYKHSAPTEHLGWTKFSICIFQFTIRNAYDPGTFPSNHSAVLNPMTTPPLPEQIELHRDRMWWRDKDLRIESAIDAERFIEVVGFANQPGRYPDKSRDPHPNPLPEGEGANTNVVMQFGTESLEFSL